MESKKKNIVILGYGNEPNKPCFQYKDYKIPISCGGMEKNILTNIDLLKSDYNIYLILLKLKSNVGLQAPGINVIPVSFKNKFSLKYLNYAFLLLFFFFLDKECFIKRLSCKKTTIMIHSNFFLALLIKVFLIRYKVVFCLENSLRELLWNIDRNIVYRIIIFFSFLIDLILLHRITTVKRERLFEKLNIMFKKCKYLPNSIDRGIFNEINVALNTKKETTLLTRYKQFIIYVGRIDAITQKNPKLLFNSFNLLCNIKSDINLLVIGCTKEIGINLVNEYVKDFKFSQNVFFIENIVNADLPLYYRTASLTLLTSYFEGGNPYVILESLACGTPCISTNVLDEGIIIDGMNGYICKTFNPEDFKECILKGLTLSEKIKANNKNIFPEDFDITHRRKRLINILESDF